MSVTLRPVRAEDAARIAAIYNDYVLHTTVSFETAPLSADAMLARIESVTRGGYPYIVAVDDDRVVGYAYAHPWKERPAYNHTWETTVYLSPRSKGRGTGRILMESLVAECRRRGCHALIACITAENSDSRRFHERLGFRKVSDFSEVGFKQGRWLDVTDYQLTL